MTKHEHPPFRMIIEGGKLIPATAYDAERLDSYRRGTEVRVMLTEEKDRPMVRKWWAVLGRAIKECKTPWQNKEQASEAIKLALGIVNLSKTVNGAWLQYPKSLTELTDPEVTEAVERMIDVIYHVTGVDASVWRKHVEHIRDEEPSEAAPHSATDDGSGEATPPPPAADQSEPAAADQEAGEPEVREEPSTAPASVSLSVDDKSFLVRVFKTMKAAVGPEVNVFRNQALVFQDEIGGKSPVVRAKAKTIRERLQDCCGDAPTKGTVEVGKYLAGVIGVDEKELVD